MGFTSGAKVLADIIDDIADGLIASSADWSDNDTTWDTVDRTADNARRSLIYTGDSADVYISFEACNAQKGWHHNGSYWYYGRGLRIVMTSSWDSVNHIYPDGGMSTFLPYFARYRYSPVYADLETDQLTYYLWIDSNGFAMIATPEPTSDDNQQSFKLSLERIATKEYADGYSNFYLHAAGNKWHQYYDEDEAENYNRNRSYLRFPAFSYPTGVDNTTAVWNYGITLPSITRHAFKSSGNGKVYYVKPVYHNDINCRTPIAQAENWFYWSTDAGLVDGDIVAIDGATTKYLCKGVSSPDATTLLTYAIKYVA